jgi:hypothetical protein
MTIEITQFFMRDEKGKRIPNSDAAHFYCKVCDTNYSSADVSQVEQAADAHALTHLPFVYVPDPAFVSYNRLTN